MTTHDFHEPIFVWLDRADPGKGTWRIDCVEEAIAALFRADISAYGNGGGHPVWTAALHHLASAKADGLPASVQSAHGAMRTARPRGRHPRPPRRRAVRPQTLGCSSSDKGAYGAHFDRRYRIEILAQRRARLGMAQAGQAGACC